MGSPFGVAVVIGKFNTSQMCLGRLHTSPSNLLGMFVGGLSRCDVTVTPKIRYLGDPGVECLQLHCFSARAVRGPKAEVYKCSQRIPSRRKIIRWR